LTSPAELFARALTRPGGSDARPARSWRDDESMQLSLDGDWAFTLSPSPDSAPDGCWEETYDDADWDRIAVPGHWVLQGDGAHGHPAYTNVVLPIPLDPPHVPDENPTGDYRTVFDLPSDWDVRQVLLRFDGVDGSAAVHLNGRPIGALAGSRLVQEFDVTDVARPIGNVLHVRVFQWSAQTYLEDQDQWWLPGIFRPVAVLGRPHGGVDDLWLRADVTDDGLGSVVPEVTAGSDAWPMRLRIPALDVDVLWDAPSDVASVEVGAVSAWSPDSPTLYDAQLIATGETVEVRLGFRSTRIEGASWLVNGRRLRLRGVNRHDFHPRYGRTFDEEDVRAQLMLMKRHNINAIRTSHYPPDPRLLTLTDEIGFWVMDECDLETHAFEEVDWVGNPSADPAWRIAYLDRIRRTVERDKQHASVIAWSLGNESHTGENIAAMAAWVRRRDPSRVIHYEGDYAAEYTDIVSRMYYSPAEMGRMSRGEDSPLTMRPGDAVRLAQMPMILCEYAHAMGNGPGGLAAYIDAFETLPQWHGGFIWEWRDHGILTTTPHGVSYHAYGGDFGEALHDNNFVMDGIVGATGEPTDALAEVAAVYAPLRIDRVGQQIRIRNEHHAIGTLGLRFEWSAEQEGVQIARGEFDLPDTAPDVTAVLADPSDGLGLGADSWLTVSVRLRAASAWAPAGHLIARRQFCVRPRQAPMRSIDSRHDRVAMDGDALAFGAVRLDARTGVMRSWAGQPVRDAEVTLWRAPTDNDALATPVLTKPLEVEAHRTPSDFPSEVLWRRAGLNRLHRRVISAHWCGDEFVIRHRLLPAGNTTGAEAEYRWSQSDAGARCDLTVTPLGSMTTTWPRVGLHLALPTSYTRARWYGFGPHQGYADARSAGWIGVHERGIDELHEPFAVPQESGHRPDIRWLELHGDDTPTLRVGTVGPQLPGFSLLPWSAAQMAQARHRHALPTSTASHLVLDAAQHGLGSRSCGPDVLPEHQLWPRQVALSLLFEG